MNESTGTTLPALPQREPFNQHPDLYAETIRDLGYDPHFGLFVTAGDTSWGGGSKPPVRDSRGRFVKAGAR